VTATPIEAVAVIVPARNEQEYVGACLRSIRRALDELPAGIATTVTIVLDRCVDRTPDRVGALIERWPQASALWVAAVGGVAAVGVRRAGTAAGPEPAYIVAGSGVGALRDLGVRDALARLVAHPPAATWLLSTDADTTVAPDWALAHLELAGTGACGVAGVAELAGDAPLSPDARRRYRAIVDGGLDDDRHRHVYGANLGVRADAYLRVGGFPADGAGEDHGLWHRLRCAGYPLVAPTAVRVQTSARTRGRAAGGLADLLLALHRAPAADS
jgi:glycosyltransferase involved in cell wall biosynthesis